MAKFKPYLAVEVGINEIGSSPYGTVSIMSIDGAVGNIGILVEEAFYPIEGGSLAAGAMVTFDAGRGRRIAFDATTAGKISSAEV